MEEKMMMKQCAMLGFSDLRQEDKGKVMKFLNEKFKEGGMEATENEDVYQTIVEFEIACQKKYAEEKKQGAQ